MEAMVYIQFEHGYNYFRRYCIPSDTNYDFHELFRLILVGNI
jgi:hypothetical protein